MVHKNAARHDANASDKLEPLALSRGQLVQVVIDLRRGLGEQWAWADREWDLIAIHRDIAKREREAEHMSNISYSRR